MYASHGSYGYRRSSAITDVIVTHAVSATAELRVNIVFTKCDNYDTRAYKRLIRALSVLSLSRLEHVQTCVVSD